MNKSAWIFFGSMFIMVWLMTRGDDDSEAGGKKSSMPHPVIMQQLETTLFFAKNNVDCGFSSSGGYAHYTTEQAAENLVKMSNASLVRLLDEPKAPGPDINFALNKVTKSWQIVVTPDSKNKQLLFEAYGPDLTKPVITEKMPCG